MLRSRNPTAKVNTQEHRAIREEIAPSHKSSFRIARIEPMLLSLLLCTVITASALLAGYLSGDWWPSRCVLVLQCLFGLYKVFKAGVEADRAEQEEMAEKAQRDLATKLPL